MTSIIALALLAALMPFLFLVLSGLPGKGAFARWGPGYDNSQPRASLARLEGWRQRAHFAQQNGHEAFAPFAVGLLLAHWAHVPELRIAAVGSAFLGFRLAHGLAYIAGSGRFRSAFWWGGFACALGLYGLALAAGL